MSLSKSTFLTAAKLGLAGASICGIAWAFMVYQPDASVRPARADILDLNFIKLSNPARFANALDYLGHDQPQTFFINDNIVNFSVNYSRKRPRQLVREYEDEFVHQGLNTQVWPAGTTFASDPAMAVEAMTGGVVPLSVSDDSATLGGVLPTSGAKTRAELKALVTEPAAEKKTLFSGHHVVEMQWDPRALHSTVTATWSDENFDYNKMYNVDQTREKNPLVPPCPGCKVVSRIRSMNASSEYANRIFSGPRSLDWLNRYYRREMAKRGWAETEASVTFNVMKHYIEYEGDEATMLQFAKGARFINITAFPGDDGNNVINATVSN